MRASRSVIMAIALVLGSSGVATAIEGTWATNLHSTGPNAEVTCLLRWQGDVYAAGSFDAVGTNATPSRVARRQGNAWEAVGEALGTARIVALGDHLGVLHAVGVVSGGRQVWAFDGGHWDAVGPVVPGSSNTLVSFEDALYVGAYRLEDGAWVNRLQPDQMINSLVVMDDLLVAGGNFSTGAGLPTGPVLAWDGDAVINAFAGQDSLVADLAVWEGQLYAARRSGAFGATAVQAWTDGAWVDVPEFGTVSGHHYATDLVAGNGRLLLARWWESPLIKSRSWFGGSVHAWNGSSVETVTDTDKVVKYLAVLDDDDGVLVGGRFTTPGQPPCANLGRVVDGAMTPVCATGFGASGMVEYLLPRSGQLAVGGSFGTVGGVVSRGVAVHDGAWHSRDLSETDSGYPIDYLDGLAWNGNALSAVGFAHYGDVIGYWNGASWQYSEVSSFPYANDVRGGSWGWLAGTGSGGVWRYSYSSDPVTIASVDGTGGVLFDHAGRMVLGGSFSAVAGVAANNIASYDGTNWTTVGGGLPGTIRALGSWNGQLVAVREVDGDPDANVIAVLGGAAWHDTAWKDICVLTGGRIRAVAEYAGNLFVGGYFTTTDDDGVWMEGIACWNGASWESVGAVSNVRALAAHDGQLWVGGSFRFVGDIPSWNLAAFSVDVTAIDNAPVPPVATLLAAPAPNPFNPRTTLSYTVVRSGRVQLDAFDATGRHVARIVDADQNVGDHSVVWEGLDQRGRALPSGTYLLRLTTGGVVATAKATLVR